MLGLIPTDINGFISKKRIILTDDQLHDMWFLILVWVSDSEKSTMRGAGLLVTKHKTELILVLIGRILKILWQEIICLQSLKCQFFKIKSRLEQSHGNGCKPLQTAMLSAGMNMLIATRFLSHEKYMSSLENISAAKVLSQILKKSKNLEGKKTFWKKH